MKKGQVVKIGKNSKIEENILTELDWPICEPREIAILIKDHLWESQETNDEAEHSDKNDHLEFNEEDEMRIRVPLSALKAANKPRMIAARLGINVENIYAFRRELRRKAKKKDHGIFQRLNKQVTRKTKAITLIKEFINEHAHQFFILSDIRNHLEESNKLESTPSLSTIRNWMK